MALIFYKYVSDPALIISSGYIRATQISALNDPFEASYCHSSLKELFDEIEAGNTSEQLIDEVAGLLKTCGVFCVTTVNDSLLMWPHYSNAHRGVALKFYHHPMLDFFCSPLLSSEPIFDASKVFLPVQYRKQSKFVVDLWDDEYHFSPNIASELARSVLLQKSVDWIYEQEHRAILPLKCADRVIVKRGAIQHASDKILRCLEIAHAIEQDNALCKSIHEVIKQDNDIIEYQFSLEEISNLSDRSLLGMCLSELLSEYPDVVFLFKVTRGALHGVIQGLNHSSMNVESYFSRDLSIAFKLGYLQKARRSGNHYAIEFVDLK